ncbi:MAG TPA: LptF/LptG family permease, partial [Prolixibacteraceae bacterium]|nr:LptF/LptG family permease [Prolixibacteraceae bacterium]
MKKFLGTFFFTILLMISISVVFDLTEKIDEFIQNQAPLKAIIFDYYLNFIPYFANLYSSLFLFISVIFFTSKLAFNSEIIALMSSGISFKRLLVPYLTSAFVVF